MIKIAPSILSANFARLGEEVWDVERGGADWLHIDVMDGHFVPNITIGPLVLQSIKPQSALFMDVHLMISNPDQYISSFVKAGADLITVHVEACTHLHRTVHAIKEQGVKVGVALNPGTSLTTIEHILSDIDLILIMTVNPGFGGQSFIENSLTKIKSCREWLTSNNLNHIAIEVDGGINEKTAPKVIEAGANVLVAGNAIFNEPDRALAIAKLRGN